ncbi:MAG: ATP-binding cassette domain-containing protein [Ktedonobacteraceae bacterium]|nr:ATP-binding cassette domain-containing protein [Ktedonobacteraceae bacterium]
MLFKFLYRNLKGYRLLVLLAILMTVTQVGSDILAALPLKFIPSKIQNPGSDPACTYPFLDGVLNWFNRFDSNPAAQTPCPLSSPYPQLAFSHSANGVIIFSVIVLLIFSILSAILVYFELSLATSIAQNLTARLRRQLFEHLQRLSLDWHGKQKKGDLVQRITGNIADIEKLVTDGLVDLLAGSLTLLGVAIIMYTISPSYTLLSIAIAPALFMIVLIYTKNIKAASKKASKAAGQVADVAAEDMNALTVIKVFTREEQEDMRFGRYVGKNREAALRAGGLQAQFTPIVAILVALGTGIIVGVGGYVAADNSFRVFGPLVIQAGAVDIGTLIVFLLYLKMLYQPMRDLSKLTNLASSAGAGAERIQEVLDQAPEVVESGTSYYGPQKLRGEISFDNVTFGYNKERLVLNGINLRIPQGKKVALVGLSGGGKTTLVKLIPRFYEVTSGSVMIDNVDNRMYPLSILRQNISMVLQDSVLFEGSIRENIEIGKPGASEQEIIEAAQRAHMHETIMSLPDGYDTYVREQGKNFSGGQRQRLAIARAILRDAPILVLDEPTASLDVEAEAEVMHALDTLVVGRTVLMISHRLSTLGNVDEIIVLKDGRIVEQGTFKDLRRQGGVFARLLEEQNRYNAERAGDKSILRSAFALPHYLAAEQPSNFPQQRRVPPPVPAPLHSAQEYNGSRSSAAVIQPASVPSKNARVLIELDGKIIGEQRLDKPVLSVGRLAGNDVSIPNQRVSRLHAKIRWENAAWIIEDADSVNGLVYEGSRVERHVFSNGDRIYVAPTAVLHYQVT